MLKVFAMIFMLIDHIGYLCGPSWLGLNVYLTSRAVGRLAFPIFAYYLACGHRRTSSLPRYALRLAFVAGLSELSFRYAHQLLGYTYGSLNVLVTFILALIFLSGFDFVTGSSERVVGRLELLPDGQPSPETKRFYHVRLAPYGIELPALVGKLIGLLMMVAALVFAEVLDSDYGAYGVLYVFVFALANRQAALRGRSALEWALIYALILNIAAFFLSPILLHADFPPIQALSIFSVLIIYARKRPEKKPSRALRYAFYAFYPVHMLAIAFIVYLIKTNAS